VRRENSVSDICFTLSEKWQTIVPEELIWLTLEQFKRDDLLEKYAELSGNFGGLNRREAIKKIGLTSLIVLIRVMRLQLADRMLSEFVQRVVQAIQSYPNDVAAIVQRLERAVRVSFSATLSVTVL
jgi:hypothetical protein